MFQLAGCKHPCRGKSASFRNLTTLPSRGRWSFFVLEMFLNVFRAIVFEIPQRSDGINRPGWQRTQKLTKGAQSQAHFVFCCNHAVARRRDLN